MANRFISAIVDIRLGKRKLFGYDKTYSLVLLRVNIQGHAVRIIRGIHQNSDAGHIFESYGVKSNDEDSRQKYPQRYSASYQNFSTMFSRIHKSYTDSGADAEAEAENLVVKGSVQGS